MAKTWQLTTFMDAVSLEDMRHWARIYDLIDQGAGSMQKITEKVGVHAKWVSKLQERLGLPGPANQLVKASHGGNTENTELGREIADHFRRVLARAAKLPTPLSSERKRIVVSAAKSTVSPVLGKAYDHYVTAAGVDKVDFEFRAAFSGNVARAVEVGKSHLGIGFNKSHSHIVHSEELFATSFVLAFHRASEGVVDAGIVWKGLATKTVLTYAHESFFNDRINAHLPTPKGQGRRVILPSMSQIYKWLHKNRGIAFVLKDFLPGEFTELKWIELSRLKLDPVPVFMHHRKRARDDADKQLELFKECVRDAGAAIREEQKSR